MERPKRPVQEGKDMVDIDALCHEANVPPDRRGDTKAMKAIVAKLGLPCPGDSAIEKARQRGRLPYFLAANRAHYQVRDFLEFIVKPAGALHGQGRGVGKAEAVARVAQMAAAQTA